MLDLRNDEEGGLADERGADPRGEVVITPKKKTEAKKIDRVLLYTDGACKGNPGPGGWAAILIDPESGKTREVSGATAATTNNRMEITAVIEGLRSLRRSSHVTVHSDSKYVVLAMSEWIHDWIRRGWRTAAKKPVLNDDLWKALLELVEKHELVEFEWVQGHSGHLENERCDQLANEAIQELLERTGDQPPARR